MPNPYQPIDTAETLRVEETTRDTTVSVPRWKSRLWFAAYGYPIWLLLSFYFVWLAACFVLGRTPVPMRDDPKYIGSWLDWIYPLPAILLIAMPLMAPLGLVAGATYPLIGPRNRRHRIRAILIIVYILLCLGVVITLRADPGRVAEWWID